MSKIDHGGYAYPVPEYSDEIELRLDWVRNDDGSLTYGLLVGLSDDPEEGASLLAEMEPTAESTEATDAARYRWLRDNPSAEWRPFALRAGATADEADAAVDAAMEARK